MGSLLDVDSSFFSSVALNATGCASGVEEASCSMIFVGVSTPGGPWTDE
jgi:hypothetical protein